MDLEQPVPNFFKCHLNYRLSSYCTAMNLLPYFWFLDSSKEFFFVLNGQRFPTSASVHLLRWRWNFNVPSRISASVFQPQFSPFGFLLRNPSIPLAGTGLDPLFLKALLVVLSSSNRLHVISVLSSRFFDNTWIFQEKGLFGKVSVWFPRRCSKSNSYNYKGSFYLAACPSEFLK